MTGSKKLALHLSSRTLAIHFDEVESEKIWIEAAFDHPQAIGSFSVARGEEWVAKSSVTIEVPDGSGGWKNITPKGFKLKWETMKFLSESITTDRIRLSIKQAQKFFIAEFELFPPVK